VGFVATTVLPVAQDAPILDFGAPAPLGAEQPSPSWAPSVLSGSSTRPNWDRAVEVPRGVTLGPRVRLTNTARAPILKTRQLWEGTITEVLDGGFAAVLSDKSNLRNSDEQVKFDFDDTEISPEDVCLIRTGASFYWIIGSQTTFGGQVMNVSLVQFRRVPAWTERKLAKAAEEARRLEQMFSEQE
jgi:hypothetical protein